MKETGTIYRYAQAMGLLLTLFLGLGTSLVTAQNTLLVTRYDPAAIESSTTEGLLVAPLVQFSQSERPIALTVDYQRNLVYWIDEIGRQIRRTDGFLVETVIAAAGTPRGLDIDPVFEKIYWTDVSLPGVKRANLDGSGEEILLSGGVTGPTGIALDVSGGRFYLTDTQGHSIASAKLDGSDFKVLLTSADGIDTPVGIVIDYADQKLYWSHTSEAPKIQRSNLDGSGQETAIDLLEISVPFALSVDHDSGQIYWSNPFLGVVQRRSYIEAQAPVETVRNGFQLDFQGLALSFVCSNSLRDSDGDGFADCLDGCPADVEKLTAGFCGCGVSESADDDLDGFPDCLDQCPTDLFKVEPGECGCNSYEFFDVNFQVSCVQFPVLDSETELTLPPELIVNDITNSVVLQLQRFSRVASDVARGQGRGRARTQPLLASIAAVRARSGQKLSFQYKVTVDRVSGGKRRTVARMTTKRNEVTVKNLTAGSYEAKYQVEILSGKKVVKRTNFSPAESFSLS